MLHKLIIHSIHGEGGPIASAVHPFRDCDLGGNSRLDFPGTVYVLTCAMWSNLDSILGSIQNE